MQGSVDCNVGNAWRFKKYRMGDRALGIPLVEYIYGEARALTIPARALPRVAKRLLSRSATPLTHTHYYTRISTGVVIPNRDPARRYQIYSTHLHTHIWNNKQTMKDHHQWRP